MKNFLYNLMELEWIEIFRLIWEVGLESATFSVNFRPSNDWVACDKIVLK
mgnify:CR=1 FL=1